MCNTTGREISREPFDCPEANHFGREWALLLLDKPILSLPGAVCISTKLDLDLEMAEPSCRIMFCGSLVHIFKRAEDHKSLKLFRVRFCKRDTVTEGWVPSVWTGARSSEWPCTC